ncbi:MAG: metallophosphoesterase [Acidaminococcaceae bacterium]|nr:metallophosphoesterase [Acidaminococcaceae bacterium]
MSNPVNVDFVTKVVEVEVNDTQKESLAATAAIASAGKAAEKANAAASSATSAANSAISANTTATQLMAYLEDKEELTAPAVDPTLSISGAAADAQITGRIKTSELPILRNGTFGNAGNEYAVASQYIIPINFDYEFLRVEFVGSASADKFAFGYGLYDANATDGMTTTEARLDSNVGKVYVNNSPSSADTVYITKKYIYYRTKDFAGYKFISFQMLAKQDDALAALRIATNQYAIKYSYVGVMNVDPTLSTSGMAADAAKVGSFVKTTYNLFDESASVSEWTVSAATLTITDGVLRITRLDSTNTAAAYYPIDVTGINNLSIAYKAETHGADILVRLNSAISGSLIFDDIPQEGVVADVSEYDTVYLVLLAGRSVQGFPANTYTDYWDIIVADSDNVKPYVPKKTVEPHGYSAYNMASYLEKFVKLTNNIFDESRGADAWVKSNCTLEYNNNTGVYKITSTVNSTTAVAFMPLDVRNIDNITISYKGITHGGEVDFRILSELSTTSVIAYIAQSGTTVDVSEYDTVYIGIFAGRGSQGFPAGTYTEYSEIMIVEGTSVASYTPKYTVEPHGYAAYVVLQEMNRTGLNLKEQSFSDINLKNETATNEFIRDLASNNGAILPNKLGDQLVKANKNVIARRDITHDTIKVAVITDTHYGGQRTPTYDSNYNIAKFVAMTNDVADVAVHLGDIVTNYYDPTYMPNIAAYKTTLATAIGQFSGINKPFIMTKGNHEVGINGYVEASPTTYEAGKYYVFDETLYTYHLVQSAEEFAAYQSQGEQFYTTGLNIISNQELFDIVGGAFPASTVFGDEYGLYCYYDVPNTNLRIISFNYYYVVNGDVAGLTAEQLTFAETALADAKTNAKVVLTIAHSALTGNIATLVNNYIDGGGFYIGHFRGHSHADLYNNSRSVSDIGFNAGCILKTDNYCYNGFCFSVVEIDLTDKMLYENRVGAWRQLVNGVNAHRSEDRVFTLEYPQKELI